MKGAQPFRELRFLNERVAAGGRPPKLGFRGADGGFDDLSRAQAARADVHVPGGTADDGPDALQVRVPPPLGHVVRMAHAVAGNRGFSTIVTSPCHRLSSLTAKLDLSTLRGRPEGG